MAARSYVSGGEDVTVISVRLETAVYEALRQASFTTRLSMATLVNEAVAAYLNTGQSSSITPGRYQATIDKLAGRTQ